MAHKDALPPGYLDCSWIIHLQDHPVKGLPLCLTSGFASTPQKPFWEEMNLNGGLQHILPLELF